MIQYNTKLLEKLVAPGIHKFTSAKILDLRNEHPEGDFWYQNHFLNSLFDQYNGPVRVLNMQLLVRSQNAFRSYNRGRENIFSYLAENQPDNPKIGQYLAAIFEWENFSIQMSIAIELLNKLNQHLNLDEHVYVKGDGGPEERIAKIANSVKHSAGQLLGNKVEGTEAIPLWLSNEGLNSYKGISVSFDECTKMMSELAGNADWSQNIVNEVRKRHQKKGSAD